MDPNRIDDPFSFPTILINEQICRQNIHQMAEKARTKQLIFRPHFKTHQSVEVGGWFREEGIDAITVSSVKMADFFSKAGWKDITIAFPVNMREIEEISRHAGKIKLNVLFDVPEQAEALALKLGSPAGYFIKIDVGYHRAGVLPDDFKTIDAIISSAGSELLHFRGFLTHAGQTYTAKSKDEIIKIHGNASEILYRLKQKYIQKYPGIIASTGDTPSCSLAEDFTGIDEIRPGNFVFYDLMQLKLGSCGFSQIAAAVICPVVSVYPDRNEALIFGGAVHLSKESLTNPDGSKNYGLIVPFVDGYWQSPKGNDYLVSLSQEHGIFRTSSQWARSLKPGDQVAVIPVHSCLAANLFRNADC
ncbi:MAG: alanine racemase [Bacteroidales bacterium]|nr:alanine racemase [Bacteroidales bacterium]